MQGGAGWLSGTSCPWESLLSPGPGGVRGRCPVCVSQCCQGGVYVFGPLSRGPSGQEQTRCERLDPDSASLPGSPALVLTGPPFLRAECRLQLQEVPTFGTTPWGQGLSSDFSPKASSGENVLDASFRIH